jgi:bacitracin transport system permease protein
MLDIIYSEFLKLKRTYIAIVIFIGGLFMSLIMALARSFSEQDMSFEKYAYNIEQVNFLMLYVVLFPLIAAYVFSREYNDKTASTLHIYPVSRIKIFIAKYLTTNILIFLVYTIQTLSIVLSYSLLHVSFPARQLIITDIKANLLSMLFQFFLIPLPILIANISKNTILPVVYGILSLIIAIFAGGSDSSSYSQYYPLLSPFFSIKYFYFSEIINLRLMFIINISFFILFMSLCIYEFINKDMV